jgi:hypothetical protein
MRSHHVRLAFTGLELAHEGHGSEQIETERPVEFRMRPMLA